MNELNDDLQLLILQEKKMENEVARLQAIINTCNILMADDARPGLVEMEWKEDDDEDFRPLCLPAWLAGWLVGLCNQYQSCFILIIKDGYQCEGGTEQSSAELIFQIIY